MIDRFIVCLYIKIAMAVARSQALIRFKRNLFLIQCKSF